MMQEDRDLVGSAQRAGHQSFLGVDLLVDLNVLVPRRETELLARTAIDLLRPLAVDREIHVVDIGTGAGNLACAIAVHLPSARVWATDISPSAVALARRNALRSGVGSRVRVLLGDLLAPIAHENVSGTLDAIVCNPPYISTSRLRGDRAHLLEHEPREAFDGGAYGLTLHQRVAREGGAHLRAGGLLCLEAGTGQARQVMLLLERAGAWEPPESRSDEDGVPRVVLARRKVGAVQ